MTKIELELNEAPVGYEYTGEYRRLNCGEFGVDVEGHVLEWTEKGRTLGGYFVVRRTVDPYETYEVSENNEGLSWVFTTRTITGNRIGVTFHGDRPRMDVVVKCLNEALAGTTDNEGRVFRNAGYSCIDRTVLLHYGLRGMK